MPEGLEPPPEGLDQYEPRDEEVVVLRANRRLWRIYAREPHGSAWDTFRHHGPTFSRFDHHLAGALEPNRSILYAAEDWATCVAEVFQEQRRIDTQTNRPWLVAFTLDHDISLLDLTGLWPTRAGGSMAINSGNRNTARQWSRAIYDAFPGIAGLRYASAMHGGNMSYAIYDRAQGALGATPSFHAPLADPQIAPYLLTVAKEIGYDIV